MREAPVESLGSSGVSSSALAVQAFHRRLRSLAPQLSDCLQLLHSVVLDMIVFLPYYCGGAMLLSTAAA